MEELHGEVNALETSAFNRQVTRLGGSTTEHHRVKLLTQCRCGNMGADGGIRDKPDAFLGHVIDAPLDTGFVELHVRNTVHQLSPDAVSTLVHGHPMTGTVQLGGAGEP